MQASICSTPFGEFALARHPSRSQEQLQAWCSADLLLLEAVAKQETPPGDTLVVNDAHGILCTALGAAQLWTDSALSAVAMRNNAAANNREPASVIWSTGSPGAARTVVMRVPKQRAFFEQQLRVLANCLPIGAVVLAAGMDKHLFAHTAQILEACIGPTRRHRGRKKARLFEAVLDTENATQTSEKFVGYYCSELDSNLIALPNVFSSDKLDGGAQLLLQHMGGLACADVVIDLACGNGVLGLAAFQQGLGKQVLFCDESAQAIASAQHNANALFPAQADQFSFHHGDGVVGLKDSNDDQRARLIVCNPPFHLEHTVDEFAGRRLLEQCANYLGAGGRLLMVANRHLDYLPTLKRGFGRVRMLAQDRRFRLWLAEKHSVLTGY